MDLFLALDAGTGSGKAFLFDAGGRLLASAARPWSYTIREDPEVPSVKHFSFDAEDFWLRLGEAARQALEQSGHRASEVAGVAATSQREACVFLDAQGREVYAGPNLDARGFREGLEILAALGADELYAITGHSAPFIFPLARYLWFRKQGGPPVAHLLMMNDWLTYRLCGALVSEPSNATESMLFDFRLRQWSPVILERFSIPASILPPVVPCGTQAGTLQQEAARLFGLVEGTPVFVGGADTQCSLLGSGCLDEGEVGVPLGTTTPLQLVAAQPLLDPRAQLWAGCHVVENRWVLESNAGDTGDAYAWLMQLLAAGTEAGTQAIERAAAECPKTDVLMFIGPAVFDLRRIALRRPGGILFPFPTLHVRPSAAELMCGFYESLAFALRANLEQLQEVWRQPISRVVVSGGMVHNPTLLRTLAAVVPSPVLVANQPQSAALGCALLMMSGGKEETLRALMRSLPEPHAVSGETRDPDRYEARYRTWKQLHDQLFELEI